jgi:hypothetical protein
LLYLTRPTIVPRTYAQSTPNNHTVLLNPADTLQLYHFVILT